MGSHRARHRSDRKQSEELATDLLARLAAEARPARPRSTPHLSLDPFATAPFPARPPRPTTQNLVLAGSGATRCAGTPHRSASLFTPTPLDPRPGEADGRGHGGPLTAPSSPVGAERRHNGAVDRALGATPGAGPTDHPFDVHATRAAVGGFPADPAAPFPIDPVDDGAEAPAGLAPGEVLDDAARTGRSRRGALRRPLYATVSATVLSATAAVAASAGPVAFTPANATPELPAQSAAAGAAALSLALPTASPAPVTPEALGGPAALLASDPSPVQASAIVARAAADAKALGAQQAATAATHARQTAAAAVGALPAHTAPPTGTASPAPSTSARPRPVAAPAPKATTAHAAPAGSSVGTRALALAKSKLGDPYVWGAAGPSAFDCSGLVVWAFKQLGIALPHSSGSLSTMGTPVSQGALQPGDLVFFYSPVSHVGIYAGNGMVLNATQSGEPVQYTKLAYLPFHNARRITG